MSSTRDRIPAHLRQHVVEQDYAAYDEVDQAVWRFVLLQTYDHLKDAAHPAYAQGLAQTGISVDRIPRIEEMDHCLGEYGWGAVAVDGFIPPRAFQEFQALGIMTIAAAIRRRRHIAYTPAPDIIHESAGHAPIVPDPKYRAFLQKFGEIGSGTFALPEDRAVYEAVRALSDIKEDRDSTPEVVAAAQRALDAAVAAVTTTSEAAKLTRLHWWTVEYGLVGRVDDYKIYGAGLLSSLGESHSCVDDRRVRKIPLSVGCTEQEYDITRPQPQLFVAEDFDHLDAVLEEFASTLAQRLPGLAGLQIMRESGEVGTVHLDGGLEIIGRLDEVESSEGEPVCLRFAGPTALAHDGQILDGQGVERHAQGYSTPLGRLEDGTALSQSSSDELDRWREGERLRLRYRSGIEVVGILEHSHCDSAGHLQVLSLRECTVRRGDRLLFDPTWGVFDLAVAESVQACRAGSSDPDFYPPTEFPTETVPRAKDPSTAAEEAQVLGLYRDALRVWSKAGQVDEQVDIVTEFDRIETALQEHRDEWLLRWNLLECLRKQGTGERLSESLRRELLAIEQTDPDSLPITTGLKYLGVG